MNTVVDILDNVVKCSSIDGLDESFAGLPCFFNAAILGSGPTADANALLSAPGRTPIND